MKRNFRQAITSIAVICATIVLLRIGIALALGRPIESALGTSSLLQTVMIAVGVSFALAILPKKTA